jgi:hypothetical protein
MKRANILITAPVQVWGSGRFGDTVKDSVNDRGRLDVVEGVRGQQGASVDQADEKHEDQAVIAPGWELAACDRALDDRRALVESGLPVRLSEFIQVVIARPGRIERHRGNTQLPHLGSIKDQPK